MRRCVLVCGIGGSGTSAVAGALHKAGCPMGHNAHLGRHPAGFWLFEDGEFYGAFRGQRPGAEGRSAMRALIVSHEREPVWGWKNTLTHKALPWLLPMLEALGNEPRVVAVHRTLTASIRARESGRCPPGQTFARREAEAWAVLAARQYTEALDVVLNAGLCRVHHVGYEDLLANAEAEVGRLISYAFDGLDVGANVWAAVEHIQRENNVPNRTV